MATFRLKRRVAPRTDRGCGRWRCIWVYLVEQQLIPYARVRQAAEALAPVEAQIKGALSHVPVLHSDETGVRRAGSLAWAHVASTRRLTYYAIHTKRGREATDAIGILPDFVGVSVHDGWRPYHAYARCRHALCNIHHLRELTFLAEQYQQAWAGELKGLLLEMKHAVEQARATGAAHLPDSDRRMLRARYWGLVDTGQAANPPPQRRPGQRGRLEQSPARNLLERLILGHEEVFAFLDDLTIPFDNNQAERDLRMLTVQQKVSGSFRAEGGAASFACIRGTCRRSVSKVSGSWPPLRPSSLATRSILAWADWSPRFV